jgi:hypothetical protein
VSASPPPVARQVSTVTTPPIFEDDAEKAGLHYRWTVAGKHPCNILQTIGNGCAFLDYDNDGNLDILLVGPEPALYKGDGRGHFTDVTHATGLDKLQGHFLGCAVGDFDGDGFDDIYLTAYRGGALLHNNKGQTFTDITKAAGLAPQPWGTSATFYDADGDGKLDLYICNYVKFGPGTAPQLCDFHGVMSSCGPTEYVAEHGSLYINLGGGRFRKATRASGFDKVSGKALGVAAAPSGRSMALAISNDQVSGDLMVTGKGATKNLGVSSGMAFAADGHVYGGMGIDWGDYDNDGRLDLAIATYQNQAKIVFRDIGGSFVAQPTEPLGMMSCVPYVAFGVKWIDFDNDGWLDLIFANGHVQDNVAGVSFIGPASGAEYRQPTVLYRNLKGQKFEDARSGLSGEAGRAVVGRGLTIGDYDNDGRMDALVVDSEGKPLLLHNVSEAKGSWLMVKLTGRQSNRDGYGAVLTVKVGGRTLTRFCHADGSYMSSSDKRVHFGLGAATKIESLQVRWPSGHMDTVRNLRANQVYSLREGGN